MCFCPSACCAEGVGHTGVGRRDTTVGWAISGASVWVSVTVVGFVVVELLVTVVVTWMKEVSKMDVVVSIVLVMETVTSSVTKTVTSLVAVAVTVTVSGPFRARGASVMVGTMKSAMGRIGSSDWLGIWKATRGSPRSSRRAGDVRELRE